MTDTKNNKMLVIEKMADILNDEANAEIEQLQKEIERLRKERDEARREAMLLLSERSSTKEMNAEYKKRGWEYLKENTND